jgi:DNA-binding HxlR family transcriptional regulator
MPKIENPLREEARPKIKDCLLGEALSTRPILDQIANKWSVLILTFLCAEPARFNAIKRRLDGITHKALTEALRRLERNGLVSRRVITSSPIAVEYSLTALGHSLQEPFTALYGWAAHHQSDIERAQLEYDRRRAAELAE